MKESFVILKSIFLSYFWRAYKKILMNEIGVFTDKTFFVSILFLDSHDRTLSHEIHLTVDYHYECFKGVGTVL